MPACLHAGGGKDQEIHVMLRIWQAQAYATVRIYETGNPVLQGTSALPAATAAPVRGRRTDRPC